MTLKEISNHPTIDPTTAPNPKIFAMGRAIFIMIAGGFLLATGAGAQTSEVRTDPRTDARTDARTDTRTRAPTESSPQPGSDSAIESQGATGPMDHYRPGWQGDGYRHGHGHRHGPRHSMMGWMLGRLDADRDGAISRGELEAEHQRHVALFDRADADHDGNVTAEELQAVHAAHRKDRRPAQRGEGRPGPSPQLELPSRSSQRGEPTR